MLKVMKTFIYSAVLLIVLGCGGSTSSDDSSSSASVTETKTDVKTTVSQGTIVDAKIDGVRYVSASQSGTSSNGGQFKYVQGETIKFYVGNILIGEMSKVPDDKLVFLQDMLNLPRTTINAQVVQVASFLQSLDTAPGNDSIIKIGKNADKFTGSEQSISSVNVSQLLEQKGITQKSIDDVQSHLANTLKSYGYTPSISEDQTSGGSSSGGSTSSGSTSSGSTSGGSTSGSSSSGGSSSGGSSSGGSSSGGSTSGGSTPVTDTTPPTFVSSVQNGRTDVSANSDIVLNFSETIKSVNVDKIILSTSTNGTNPIAISATKSGSTVSVNPSSDLTAGTIYYLFIKAGAVTDNANNTLTQSQTISFTVKSSDTTTKAPAFVNSTQAGKTNVSVSANIVLSFSENLKSIDASKIVLSTDASGTDKIAKLTTLTDSNVVINPDENLAVSTRYYVFIKAGAVTDNDDNALTQEANFDFTTSSSSTPVTTGWLEYEGVEYLALQDHNVSNGLGEQTCQANGGTLADSDKIGVTNITKFAKALYLTHYESDYLMKGGYFINSKFSSNHAAWGRSGGSSLFPADDEVYVICEKSKTGEADNTPPILVNANPPTKNANSVSVGSNITLTFNEDLKTINVDRFILSTDVNANSKISTTISRTGKVVTINPNSSLSPNTTYYVHIKSGCATDKAGNAYASSAYYTFKTEDSLTPTPANNWTAVSGIDGYKFKRFDDVVTYNSAVAKCQVEGGVLATKTDVGINTSSTGTENDNLANMITALSLSKGDKYWYSSGGYEYTVSYDNASDKWKPKNTYNGSAKYICKKADSTTGGGGEAPSTFTEYSNGYYKIGKTSLYWDAALQLCQNLGDGITLLPKAQAEILLQDSTFKNSLKKSVLGSVDNHWIAENNASYGNIITQSWTTNPIEIGIAGKKSGAQPAYVCYKPKTSVASVGSLHDALVIGATYKSGSYNGTTNEQGEFNFMPGEKVEFFAGAVKIGGVQTVPDDKKVFLQDIVGVNRENVNNAKVIKIATFLQSLDSQKSDTNVVDLTEKVGNFTDDVDLNASDVNVVTLLNDNGISDVVSENDVKNHIKASLNANSISADTTAPTLTSTFSANPSPSSTLSISSDENLSKSSVTSENVKLYLGGSEISASVSLDDTKKVISIKPATTLNSTTAYSIKITNVSDENENKTSKTIDFTTADAQSPSIDTSSSTPTNGATDVALDSDITLHVSENVDVDDSKIKLYKVDGNESINTTITGTGTQDITIDPNNDLDSQKEYKLVVSKEALKDSSGNALDGDFTLSFTTEDKIAPTLNQTATSLHPNTLEYKITASEDLDQSSVNTTNITLTKSGSTVAINVSYANKVITIKPNANLDSSTDYTLTLKDITDLHANKADTKSIDFKTLDADVPTVSSTSIDSHKTAVGVSEDIVLNISEVIKTDNINTANITLKPANGSSVDVAVSYADQKITINPTNDLESTTTYTLTVNSNTLVDSSNNANGETYNLEFTTKDEKKPTFISSNPANEATKVATDANIIITFSEDIKILDSNEIVLSLAEDGTSVVTDGMVATLDTNTSKVKITLQKDNISFNTDYYIIIPTTAIADTSNNQLESKISIKFTTKAEDWKEVSGISGYTFKAFYEKVSSGTATSNCVTAGGSIIEKDDVDINNNWNGFNSQTKISAIENSLGLDTSKEYWVKLNQFNSKRIKKGSSWSVSGSGSTAYYICKKQVLTASLSSTSVSVGRNIVVGFSKAVDSTTITDQSVSLVVKGESTNLLTSGDLSIDDKTLTITPNSDLTEGITYTLTLDKSIIKDSGGDFLTSTNSFEFTVNPASSCDGKEYNGGCYVVSQSKVSSYENCDDGWSLVKKADIQNDLTNFINSVIETQTSGDKYYLYNEKPTSYSMYDYIKIGSSSIANHYDNYVFPAYKICKKLVLTANLKSSNVYVGKSIIVEFNKAVNSSTITSSSVSLVEDGDSTNLLSDAELSVGDKNLTITPNPDLVENDTYTLTLDRSIIKDSGNEALNGDNTFTFTVKPKSNCPENFVEYPTGSGKCYSVAKVEGSYNSSKCSVGDELTYQQASALYKEVGKDEFDSGFATTLELKKDGSSYLLDYTYYTRRMLKWSSDDWYIKTTYGNGYQICYIEN